MKKAFKLRTERVSLIDFSQQIIIIMKPLLEQTGKEFKGDDEMVRCTNCDYKWKKKDVLVVVFATRGKTCPNCGKKQYLSKDTQHYLSLGYVSLFFLLIMPFVVKLSDREERIW